jgi:hypothetical protein
VAETPVNVDISYTGDDFPAGFDALAEAAIADLINALPIGGLVARSALIAVVDTLAKAQGATSVSVTCTTPAADIAIDYNKVATEGTIAVGAA